MPVIARENPLCLAKLLKIKGCCLAERVGRLRRGFGALNRSHPAEARALNSKTRPKEEAVGFEPARSL